MKRSGGGAGQLVAAQFLLFAASLGAGHDWGPPGAYCSAGEPLEAFRARMAALTAWLEARDEAVIGVTCHWGVLAALTGTSFENCEVRRIPLADLRVRTDVEY